MLRGFFLCFFFSFVFSFKVGPTETAGEDNHEDEDGFFCSHIMVNSEYIILRALLSVCEL